MTIQIPRKLKAEILDIAKRIDVLTAQRQRYGVYLRCEFHPTVLEPLPPEPKRKSGTCLMINELVRTALGASMPAPTSGPGPRRTLPLLVGRDYLALVARDPERVKSIGLRQCAAVTPAPKGVSVRRCRRAATDGGYCEEHASRPRSRFDPISLLKKWRPLARIQS